ncbi:MAG: methylmalonyl Co-A mutase-associated GTPase MeaB [Acidiferrobacteraceae bacterium]|jgi:LAO/AO transport system kinase|nr:methylmalonyl Co-A mutase-associated GTPase MeaB [Acidiferrobacteraceae bacterium]MCP4828125.1 methylmalonyl Co-A mutase-associated GTPase MeaB [Pseudomonadota bacterium]MDP6950056.1 methylmalonyl Co-A mutase-associated GTPase MeaB [Arenicellales bacterium]HJP06139.1 methylmalonyl Co-A mutase-associated GTPase MeaB [Arenicellales bacterium]|tara:strand:+ start:1615 stop:2607 length:993 start_codon:yes stop_codon:yes gene_type:complete
MSTVSTLADAICSGDRRALAQAITLVESILDEHQAQARELLTQLMGRERQALRIGITGVPGAGKSTFIEALGEKMIDRGASLAVLTVDPSSAISGGSILGDKTRMPRLAASNQAFIRPSPSAGNEGGVGRYTREAITLCEAAGFDHIIVETVGVGQSELRVAQMTDLFVLLLVPGAGDELQGIKRGVMELADVILVNKCDGELQRAAQRAVADYTAALRLMQPRTPGWTVPVLAVSAHTGEGVSGALDAIEGFHQHSLTEDIFSARRSRQAREALAQVLREGLLEHFMGDPETVRALETVRAEVVSGRMTPGVAAQQLLEAFTSKEGTRE